MCEILNLYFTVYTRRQSILKHYYKQNCPYIGSPDLPITDNLALPPCLVPQMLQVEPIFRLYRLLTIALEIWLFSTIVTGYCCLFIFIVLLGKMI